MSDNEAVRDTGQAETDLEVWTRETAPQSPYTMRQVGLGILIAVVAGVITFGVPLLFT